VHYETNAKSGTCEVEEEFPNPCCPKRRPKSRSVSEPKPARAAFRLPRFSQMENPGSSASTRPPSKRLRRRDPPNPGREKPLTDHSFLPTHRFLTSLKYSILSPIFSISLG
jgi:hypothetical protein